MILQCTNRFRHTKYLTAIETIFIKIQTNADDKTLVEGQVWVSVACFCFVGGCVKSFLVVTSKSTKSKEAPPLDRFQVVSIRNGAENNTGSRTRVQSIRFICRELVDSVFLCLILLSVLHYYFIRRTFAIPRINQSPTVATAKGKAEVSMNDLKESLPALTSTIEWNVGQFVEVERRSWAKYVFP